LLETKFSVLKPHNRVRVRVRIRVRNSVSSRLDLTNWVRAIEG